MLKDFKKWQEEKKKAEEEIRVGDIVRFKGRQDIVVTNVRIDRDSFDGIDANGEVYSVQSFENFENWDKVGHIDEVEQLLDKMKGKEE